MSAGQLIDQALEVADPLRRRALAERALDLWPDCADAYNLLAEQAEDALEAADLFRQGLDAGRRALGEERFSRAAAGGAIWGVHEARPYARAAAGLAHALCVLGLRREAVARWRELLRLDLEDNLGAHEALAPVLLELAEHDELEALLERHQGVVGATWLYCRALLDFRRGHPGAGERLDAALEGNPFVPAYLLGDKELPDRLPDLVGRGDESEAVVSARGLQEAWWRTEGAVVWLRERCKTTAAPLGSRRRRTATLAFQSSEAALGATTADEGRVSPEAAEVARLLDDGLERRGYDARLRRLARRLWGDFAAQTAPTISQPPAHAAAMDHALNVVLELHEDPQAMIAQHYGTTPESVAAIADAIVRWFDEEGAGGDL